MHVKWQQSLDTSHASCAHSTSLPTRESRWERHHAGSHRHPRQPCWCGYESTHSKGAAQTRLYYVRDKMNSIRVRYPPPSWKAYCSDVVAQFIYAASSCVTHMNVWFTKATLLSPAHSYGVWIIRLYGSSSLACSHLYNHITPAFLWLYCSPRLPCSHRYNHETFLCFHTVHQV